jgi:hypothetical protein
MSKCRVVERYFIVHFRTDCEVPMTLAISESTRLSSFVLYWESDALLLLAFSLALDILFLKLLFFGRLRKIETHSLIEDVVEGSLESFLDDGHHFFIILA